MLKTGIRKIAEIKKRYIIILFVVFLLILLGYETWEDKQDDLEEYSIETLLPFVQENLNIDAIREIQKRVKGKEDFRFVVLGDSEGNQRIFKKILNEAAKHNPDFIVHTGDLTSGGKYHQYMEVIELVEQFDIPIVFVMGNHDIGHRGAECFSHMFGPFNFYFDVGQYRFIFINNNDREGSSDFAKLPDEYENYGFLKGIDDHELKELEVVVQGKEHNFIVMHVPPPIEPFRFHSFTRNSEGFANLMKQYSPRVLRVFCGHIQGYGETTSDGVVYIVTGGAGGKLLHSRNGIISKFNYVMVNVVKGKATHKVIFVD